MANRATRYAELKFVVSGGDQLKKETSAVNAEIKKLRQELTEVQTNFRGQQNTYEALTAKVTKLNEIYTELQKKLDLQKKYLEEARSALDKCEREFSEQEEAIKRTSDALEEARKHYSEDSKEVTELKDKLAKLQSQHNVTTKAVQDGRKAVSQAAEAVSKTNVELNKAGIELDDYRKYQEDAARSVTRTTSLIDEQGRTVDQSSKTTAEAVDMMASALIASGVKRALSEIKDALMECVEASAEFDAALTGVAKTTDLTGPALAAFGEDLKELSTKIPMSAAELAEIAEMAGQLGIKEESLLSFTETIAALSVSTNIIGSEGAENLARFMNIMGTSQDNVDRLGASIVDLGNNFATTENEILEMAMNLAGAGRQAGLSEADILGIATAISSVGIEAGKGGTAFSKMLNQMTVAVATGSSDIEKFASIAGMTADEFARLYNDNAIEAIDRFYTGLGNGSETAIELLSEMGVKEVRLRDTMLRLASSSGMLTDAVQMSNEAYEQNIALTHEANLFYGTTESQTKLLQNAMTNLKIAVGDALNPALNRLKAGLTDVIANLTKFLQQNPGVVKAITAIVTGIAAFASGLTTISMGYKVFESMKVAVTALSGALSIGSASLLGIVGAIAAVIAVAAAFIMKAQSVNKEVEALNAGMRSIQESANAATGAYQDYLATMEATHSVAEDYIKTLDLLDQQTTLNEQDQAIYNDTVAKLRDLYPDIQIEIDETTGKVKGGTEALWEQINAWEESARTAAQAEYVKKMAEAVATAEIELRKTQIERQKTEDALNTAVSNRAEAEKEILYWIGSEAESLSLLNPDEREYLELLLKTNPALKEVYDRYTELRTEEDNQRKKLAALEQAEEDQQKALEELQEDLADSKQAVSELGDEYAETGKKIENTDMFKSAASAADGAVRGVISKIGDYEAAWRNLALAGQRAYRNVDQIASPSKVYKQLATFDVEGLVEGTKDQKQRLEDAYADLALRGQVAFTNAAETINNSYGGSTVNIYTTDLSQEKIDYIYDKINRRMNRV